MKTQLKQYLGIKLEYNTQPRTHYMSFQDCARDLKTNCLIEILKASKKINTCIHIFELLENRADITENQLTELYDSI